MNQASNFFYSSKGSTIDRTHAIIRSLDEAVDKIKLNEHFQKDIVRLSHLYGHGVGQIKSIKGRKSKLRGDESDFECSENDWLLARGKLDHSLALFEKGTTSMQSLGSTYISLSELRHLLDITYSLKFSLPEMSAIAKNFDAVEGMGSQTTINFIKFLTALKRYADELRNIDRRRRLKERDDREKSRLVRQQSLSPRIEEPDGPPGWVP